MNTSVFLSLRYSDNAIKSYLWSLGFLIENKEDLLSVKNAIFADSQIFNSTLSELKKIIDPVFTSNLDLSKMKHFNGMKKAFKRAILRDILQTDYFPARSAILISRKYDTFLIRTENIELFTAIAYIEPTYSNNANNKSLMGYLTLTKQNLSNQVKGEIFAEFVGVIESIEEELSSELSDSIQEYGTYIMSKY